jgi:hypothetical protein
MNWGCPFIARGSLSRGDRTDQLVRVETKIAGLLRGVVRWFDRELRRVLGIAEFSSEAGCILRVAEIRAPYDVQLRDGVGIPRGSRVGELHFWNERVEQIVVCDKGLSKGARLKAAFEASLRCLAVHAAIEPDMQQVLAFRARFCRWTSRNNSNSLRIDRWHLLTVVANDPSFWGTIHDALESILLRALLWTFNPQRGGARGRYPHRIDVWISRETLLQLFEPPWGLIFHHIETAAELGPSCREPSEQGQRRTQLDSVTSNCTCSTARGTFAPSTYSTT